MEPSPLSVVPPAAERPISAGEALVGTFTQPGNTFERLVRRPTWWLPLLLVLGSLFGVVSLTTPKIDLERSMRETLEKRAEKTGETVSAQKVEQATAFSKKFAAWSAPIALFVGLLAFFFVGLVLWGTARAFGAEASYGQTLAIWAHAQVVLVFSTLVSIPVILQQPDDSITQDAAQYLVKSNVGAFLPDSLPHFVRVFALSLDVFSFGVLLLLVIGFRRLPGLSKGSATAIPIGLWFVYVLFKTGFAVAFG
jgi:hypothetical protein